MILCIDTTVLKNSPDVQRDVDLEDLLINHTKYFDNEEQALKENFAPLDFCTTVRTMYGNLVMQVDAGEEKRYYTNLSQIQPFVHKGYDLIMYLTSIGLMHNVEYKIGFDKLMTEHSQFCPIGLFNPPLPITNPIIYSHILISDEGAEEFSKYLREGVSLVPIESMKEHRQGNVIALLDTIIEVKEENKDEQRDND